jgi:hypothetical protein
MHDVAVARSALSPPGLRTFQGETKNSEIDPAASIF